ncbi:hypothetical protein E2562_009652 [Oryza meyeriana var. granulata]|uniref:Uncharacterized protein n=1 Tax=Oryza meyeriana var. granulata TaxID=110450 RepID=A0A6G1D072_9ORYZ|nr:hypothetical protein E2562_009652 [Oryza meyeriana var. granulata]
MEQPTHRISTVSAQKQRITMAHGLAVTTLLLVALAAVARPFAHAAPEYPADAPAVAKESPAGKADVPAAAAESPEGTAAAPVAGTSGEGLTYVEFVIKNPVKSKDSPGGRDDGLPIDPTPDGQLQY